MPGILAGLRVLDLSWGIAGPMTAMVLGDMGASVTKIEPPKGDPLRDVGRCQLGYRTWQRGKRNAILDLKDPGELDLFLRLVADADILVESFSAGATDRLGIDYETVAKINPRLIYVTIDGYRDTRHADRPAIDLLVGARMGIHWEHRGWPEGTMFHTSRLPDPYPEIEMPYEWRQGPPREGPIVVGTPWASLGSFYAAFTAISAAIYARESTGRGQHIHTSLMNGAAAAMHSPLQRGENSEAASFATWAVSAKSHKGHFECGDGRWVHMWVANPRFVMSASEGDTIEVSPELSAQNDPDRFGTGLEEILVIGHYAPLMAERVAKFTADEWVSAAAIADQPVQEARSPEAALADPLLLADGCVREIEDPELGRIRQVGKLIEFEKVPYELDGPAHAPGQDTAAVKAEAAILPSPRTASAASIGGGAAGSGKGPLAGIRVLDIGLAVAGPFAGQVLGDLGADVIKVNAFHDGYWHRNHLSFVCNRSKRSLCVDLKHPDGLNTMLDLVKTADVVVHNMRYDAAERLGIDYETLKKVRPDLIYCHMRGHEHGPRETLPGNEQTASCLAGVQYEDGAMAAGGKPLWCLTMLGDIGAGYLAANGIMQALYHRRRTGEGQFVSTSIINAHLLNSSYVVARPDGEAFERPRVDRMQFGFSALHRLYPTGDGWLALAALSETDWAALKAAIGASALEDDDFATAALRTRNDERLAAALTAIFAGETAQQWQARLEAAGVPSEVSDQAATQNAQDDPDYQRIGMMARFDHLIAGRLDQMGAIAELSDTPITLERPPLILGDGTTDILTELGYMPDRLAKLAEDKVIGAWQPGEPLIEGSRRPMSGGRPGRAKAELAATR